MLDELSVVQVDGSSTRAGLARGARAVPGREGLDDAAFWRELRGRVLPLSPSQYDLTSRCNLSCEGCLFFSGSDSLGHSDEERPEALDRFFAAEAARGVRFGYFAGAEPSLVEAKLRLAARHIPYGTVFTNGTRRITDEVPYRVHVSVWGRPERDRALRGASMIAKQARNYRGDARAVFVFTVTAQNIGDIPWVADFCADGDLALTFNHYSPTAKYRAFVAGAVAGDRFHARGGDEGGLALGPGALRRAADTIGALLEAGHGRILYSPDLSAALHDPAGLYPARDADGVARDCGVRLGPALRHHNTDLSRSAEKCCTPNVDCASCRLYAQSFATLLTRATRDLRGPGGQARLVALWRLWCALFLNDARLSAWAPAAWPGL